MGALFVYLFTTQPIAMIAIMFGTVVILRAHRAYYMGGSR
jgi:hypothetical protein